MSTQEQNTTAEIVFLRHGRALGVREAGVASDAERPLSPSGEQDVLAAAARLRDSGFAPDLVIHSPFVRAARTAELAASLFPGVPLRPSAALSDGPASAIVDLVETAGARRLLVVGHQPLLGAVAGFCAGGAPLDLSASGYARLKAGAAPGEFTLEELYEPPEKRP